MCVKISLLFDKSFDAFKLVYAYTCGHGIKKSSKCYFLFGFTNHISNCWQSNDVHKCT